MAYIFGVASQEHDLYRIWRDFMTGCGRPGQIEFSGTGNGRVNNLIYPDGSPLLYETVTLTCVTAEARKGTFSVQASSSGTLPDAVVGQVYKHTSIEFYLDFGLTDFAPGDTFTLRAASKPANKAGFSRVQGRPDTVTETFTLTCSRAGVQGGLPAQFSVQGSVSGSLPTLTQGTLYEATPIRLLLAADTSANQYAVGETLTLRTRINHLREVGQHWATLRQVASLTTTQFGKPIYDGDSELVLKGPGLSGTDEIFYGMQRFWSDGDARAHWNHYPMAGFVPALAIADQPQVQGGSSANATRACHTMWSQAIPYTIIASGRRFILLTRSNIYYSQSYQGFILPSTLPKYWGYPYFSGGTGDNRNISWSSLPSSRSAFWNYLGESEGGSAYVLAEDKGWRTIYGSNVEQISQYPVSRHVANAAYPHSEQQMFQLRNNLDGSVPLFQVQITPNRGFLDGVFAVPGRDGRQPEEIIVTREGKRLLVAQNHHRSGFNDFCAFALE